MTSNSIKEGDIHNYKLTLWYINTAVDQSDDMGKSYQARVNITDITVNNPYSTGIPESDNKSLVYNIINNAKQNKNGTSLVNVPLTTPGKKISSNYIEGEGELTALPYFNKESLEHNSYLYAASYEDAKTGNPLISCEEGLHKYVYFQGNGITYKLDKCIDDVGYSHYSEERTLNITQDNYGTSYYFRGNVENNYVNFAGMCFRIVRIEGDGSIKLLLDDKNTECDNQAYNRNRNISNSAEFGKTIINGTTYVDYETDASGTTIKNVINEWVSDKFMDENNNLNSFGLKLQKKRICLGDNSIKYSTTDGTLADSTLDSYYFKPSVTLNNGTPSMICYNNELSKESYYASPLTLDEVLFAGPTFETDLNSYISGNSNDEGTFAIINSSYHYNKLVPNDYFLYLFTGSRIYYTLFSSYSLPVTPAISLKSDITISGGEGTQTNPYIIN